VVDKHITGVVVCYNTKELVDVSYNSVRRFHPQMRIVIVDGSDEGDLCYQYVASLSSEITMTVQTAYNIGHGRGMCVGIYYAETPYVLLFDSDIEMLKSPVKSMLDMMEEDTFGVGYFEKTGFDGFDYGALSHHKRETGMKYLHPYFQLLNVKNYKKFHPYVHHGAPCYLTMLDIHKRGLSDKILKEFPGLGHSAGTGYSWTSAPREFIRHDVAGTRNKCRSRGKREVEGVWELNKERIC
jgi:GT2 family glycosyltransferase